MEKYVPLELFLEVLDKYKESESEVIYEFSSNISADLKNLDKEIAEYRKLAGVEE